MFVNLPYMDLNYVYAVQVMNNAVYLLGYMEDSEHYKIKKIRNPYAYKLEGLDFEDIKRIREKDYKDNIRTVYNLDDNGDLMDEVVDCINERYMFLRMVNPVGKTDERAILLFESTNEFHNIVDLLKDGDYIIIVVE